MNDKCGFCGRPATPIPDTLGRWCNPWCWVMDKNTPYKPSRETFNKIIKELRENYETVSHSS